MTRVLPAPSSQEERIREILQDLIRDRRRMGASADEGLLHANRLGIVYWRLQLARLRTEAATRQAS